MAHRKLGSCWRHGSRALKLSSIGCVFMLCLLTQFPHNGPWIGVWKSGLYDEADYSADINFLSPETRSVCRLPQATRKVSDERYRQNKLREALERKLMIQWTNKSIVSVVTSSRFLEKNPEIFHEVLKGIRTVASAEVHYVIMNGSTQLPAEILADSSSILCIDYEPCLVKDLGNSRLTNLVMNPSHQIGLLPFFSHASMDTKGNPNNDTNDASVWIVGQKSGSTTFVRVLFKDRETIKAKLVSSNDLQAAEIPDPVLSLLEQPVIFRTQLISAGEGSFYLPASGRFYLGGLSTFGSSEKQSQLSWSPSQFFQHSGSANSHYAAAEFQKSVEDILSKRLIEAAELRALDCKPSLRYVRLLEVTALIDTNLNPIPVSIVDVVNAHEIPTSLLKKLPALLSLQQPNKETVDRLYEKMQSLDISIQGKCEESDLRCLTSSELEQLLHLLLFEEIALRTGFRPLYIHYENVHKISVLMDCLSKVFPVNTNFLDLDNEPQNQTNRGPQCVKGSLFGPLIQRLDLPESAVITPPFNPLTTSYGVRVPFSELKVTIRIHVADCNTQAILRGDNTTIHNHLELVVGLGHNIFHIDMINKESPGSVRETYTIDFVREKRRQEFKREDNSTKNQTCYLIQHCNLVIHEDLPCGLQRFDEHGDLCAATEHWTVSCEDCKSEESCDWKNARWWPSRCPESGNIMLEQETVRNCLKNKKLAFIGDSTNRGIMSHLIEQSNGSLWDNEKIHSARKFSNLNNGSTEVSFSYYPQFWIPESRRPTFTKAVSQALKLLFPTEPESLAIVVGGVQFLRPSHLFELRDLLSRRKLDGIKVVVKTFGAGFFVPLGGGKFLNKTDLKRLFRLNQDLIATAKQLGFQVVDTFSMTLSRFKEFHPGKCNCHFHSVNQIPDSNPVGPHRYTVEGPINALYAQQVLRQICSM